MTVEDHKIRIGDYDVTAVYDGFLTRPIEVMIGAEKDRIAALAGKTVADPLIISVNAYLIEGRGIRALVDAGSGTSMGPDLGLLPRRLEQSGRPLDTITHVLLTHIHPDHTNGLVDADGRALFPKAEVVVQEDEIAYWVDRDPSQARDEGERRNMGNARKSFAPYGRQTTRRRDGEHLPGLSLTTSPGHTPGHCCWTVEGGGDSLVIWGDTLHLPAAQLIDPDIGWGRDIDAAMAIRSRRRLLDRLSADRTRVAGMHHDFPGFARLARRGDTYAFDFG